MIYEEIYPRTGASPNNLTPRIFAIEVTLFTASEAPVIPINNALVNKLTNLRLA